MKTYNQLHDPTPVGPRDGLLGIILITAIFLAFWIGFVLGIGTALLFMTGVKL